MVVVETHCSWSLQVSAWHHVALTARNDSYSIPHGVVICTLTDFVDDVFDLIMDITNYFICVKIFLLMREREECREKGEDSPMSWEVLMVVRILNFCSHLFSRGQPASKLRSLQVHRDEHHTHHTHTAVCYLCWI